MLTTRSRPRLWIPLTTGVGVFALVTIAGLLIVASPTWSATEVQIVAWVQGGSNGFLDVVATTINTVFGPSGAPLVGLTAVAWVMLLSRSWRPALRFAVVLVVPWAAAEVLKAIVQRPRPDSALLQPMIVPDPVTFSYPSGHTAFAAALCCALLFVVVRTRWALAASVSVLVVLMTAWSRVYLGVHYPTDVLASMVAVPAVAFLAYGLIGRVPGISGLRAADGDGAGGGVDRSPAVNGPGTTPAS